MTADRRAHLQGLVGLATPLGLDIPSFQISHTNVGQLAPGWAESVGPIGRRSFFDGSTDLFNASMVFDRDPGIGAVVPYNGDLDETSFASALDAGLDGGLDRAADAVPEPRVGR